MEKQYVELEARVRALELTLGVFERMLGASLSIGTRPAVSVETTYAADAPVSATPSGLLPRLTVKQHVALQMLLAGRANSEIAERFGVTENGAKVYVRAIYKKFGVKTRSQAVMAVVDEFTLITDRWYEAISKGIPKNWAREWLGRPVEEDPYRTLYQARQNEEWDE